MAFKRTDTVKSVPTHLKWIVSNPEKVGEKFPIVLVIRNADWKTFTFFSKEFKFNIKVDSSEEFEEVYDELQKSFRRGYVLAYLEDKTNLEEKSYTCEVFIEACPKEKGGRGYEVDKNRYKITLPRDYKLP